MMVDLYLVNSINGRIMSYFCHHIMSRLEINQSLRLFRPLFEDVDLYRIIMYHSRTNLTFISSVSWLASPKPPLSFDSS